MRFGAVLALFRYTWNVLAVSLPLVSLLFLVAALVTTFLRLHYGVDFTDEAFAVALPYRFVLGDKPFVHDWTVTQSVSLLVYPLVFLFHKAHAGIEGIILFTRKIYFLFTLTIAVVSFLALRKYVRWALALLLSTLFIVFVPYQIPNFTYNSLGVGLFTVGIFLALLDFPSRWKYLACGLLHGLACIAHPMLFIPSFGYGIILVSWVRPRGLIIWYAVGIALVPLILASLFQHEALAIFHTLSYTVREMQVTGGYHLTGGLFGVLLQELLYPGWLPLIIVASFFFLPWVSGRGAPVIALGWIALVHVVAFTHLPEIVDGLGKYFYLLYLCLIAPFLLFSLYLRRNEKCFLEPKKLLVLVWLPSFIAGLALSTTSSDGLAKFGVAALPAVIVSCILIGNILSEVEIAPYFFAALTFATFLHFQRFPHKNGSIETLTATVQSGPFKGLATTPIKEEYLRHLTTDLAAVAKPGSKILFYYQFPAGYLLTNLKPAMPSLWMFCSKASWQECISYYEKSRAPGDIVVRIRANLFRNGLEIPYEDSGPIIKPFDSFIQSSHAKILSSGLYDIYSDSG